MSKGKGVGHSKQRAKDDMDLPKGLDPDMLRALEEFKKSDIGIGWNDQNIGDLQKQAKQDLKAKEMEEKQSAQPPVAAVSQESEPKQDLSNIKGVLDIISSVPTTDIKSDIKEGLEKLLVAPKTPTVAKDPKEVTRIQNKR